MDISQLKNLQSKLRQLNQARIEADFRDEILNNSEEIVQLVRERWKLGKRPNGEIIGTYRSFAYEMEKRQKNPLAGGKVDLMDTHALERNLVVNHLSGAMFNIFSTDSKAVGIAEKYGLDVYGLTKEEETEVINEAVSRTMAKQMEFIGL